MAAPTPIVTAPPDFLELPPGGTYQFTGSSSPIGASYAWTLVEWPPEATGVVLNNANTSTPTLSGITARGTYIVFLKVTNSFGESHPQPYPIQATTAPYGFSTPVATAFGVLRIAEAGSDALNPIFKPGRGEYGWFEKGLWPLVKKVGEGLSFPYYDIPTRELTANSIVADPTVTPFTTAISLEGFSITKDDAQAEHELVSSHDKINVLSHTVVTGKDLTVSGGTLKADDISDASGGDISIVANATAIVEGTSVAINSSTGDISISAGDDLVLTASDDVAITAPGATGVITLSAAQGMTLTTTGVGAAIVASSEAGLQLEAGTTARITSEGDIVAEADNDVSVTAARMLQLATTGVDGDLTLSTEGASSAVSVVTTGLTSPITIGTAEDNSSVTIGTGGVSSGISITTAGDSSGIALTATGATSNIALVTASNIAITATSATSDITLTAGNNASVSTDDGNIVLMPGGDAVLNTVDRTAQVTFTAGNKRRIIDLDGYVSQRNHRMTSGGVATQITPNGVLTWVPFRDGVTADYTYETLCGEEPTPDFVIAFHATFNVTQFSTDSGHYLTLLLRIGLSPLAPATTVTLAGFTFQPGGTTEATDQPCIVSGTIHSTGSKALFTSGMAALQLDDSNVSTKLAAASVDASAALTAGNTSLFAFYAISNDPNAIIGNVSASFTLMRGS